MRKMHYLSPTNKTASLNEEHHNSEMDDLTASPSFRRTQSCRVPKSQAGLLRKGSKQRSRSRQKTGATGLSSLTYSQKQALTQSWRQLRPTANSIFRKVFLELEVACPKVKQIFYKAALVDAFNREQENVATMDEHVKMIIRMFDDLVGSIDNETECMLQLKQIGVAHAILSQSCAFAADIWEKLGEIAVQRITSVEPVIKSREAARAWMTVIACAIDELRSGFEGEARVFSRKSSSTEALEMKGESDLQEKLHQLRIDFDSTIPM